MKSVLSSAGEEITDATATRDLGAMARAGLLTPVGEKRGRSYHPSDELSEVWRSIRQSRPQRGTDDPYDLVQPELPGLGPR